MDRRAFLEYMNGLEQRVIVPGFHQGLFGSTIWATIRNGKLHSSEFAELLGTRFWADEPMVIEYYGLHKRSTGFMRKAEKVHGILSGFDVPFVNFSSVRDIHLKSLAEDLLIDFPTFKQEIIRVRFPNSGAS